MHSRSFNSSKNSLDLNPKVLREYEVFWIPVLGKGVDFNLII